MRTKRYSYVEEETSEERRSPGVSDSESSEEEEEEAAPESFEEKVILVKRWVPSGNCRLGCVLCLWRFRRLGFGGKG